MYSIAPRGANADGRVLYFHGGAYVAGMSLLHWMLVSWLVRKRRQIVIVPMYRPAPAETARTTVPRALRLYRRLRADPRPLTVIGDSAGAGLALAMAQLARDEGVPQPGALVLVSPWVDATVSAPQVQKRAAGDAFLAAPGLDEAARIYAGDLDRNDFRVSPLFGSLADLAPITIVTGTKDMLNTDAHRLRDRALAVGTPVTLHEYRDMMHVFPLFPIPEARRARTDIARALAR